MKVQTNIQKWGNSLALRLTGPIRSIPHFKENMTVTIDIQEDGIHVSPTRSKSKALVFTEAQLLKGLNAKTAHADEAANLSANEIGE